MIINVIKQKVEKAKKQSPKRLCEYNLRQITLRSWQKKKMKLDTSGSQHKKISEKIVGVLRHGCQPLFVNDTQLKVN